VTKAELCAFLKRYRLATLATVNASSRPESAVMGIAVTDDLELIFDTLKTSRKYANLLAQPTVALVIGWDAEQTVQYEGIAEELGGEALRTAKQVYFKAWPDGRDREHWPAIAYFKVRPTWARFSDFSPPSPRIVEMELA
jgi:pyridoxine/pyridoxamine 5'-phosphate oxidase